MKPLAKYAVAAAAMMAALPAVEADAATLVVDLAGIQTVGRFGDPANVIRTFDIGANAYVTGFAYDITVSTIGESYLSEASVAFSDLPPADGVLFTPGTGDTFSGTARYTGFLDLTDQNLDFFVGPNGVLRVEFYELFDDNPGADANLSGSLTFTYETAISAVPEPATWGMMLLGFGMIGASVRRRSVVKTAVTFA